MEYAVGPTAQSWVQILAARDRIPASLLFGSKSGGHELTGHPGCRVHRFTAPLSGAVFLMVFMHSSGAAVCLSVLASALLDLLTEASSVLDQPCHSSWVWAWLWR